MSKFKYGPKQNKHLELCFEQNEQIGAKAAQRQDECARLAVSKISDCQPEGPGFNPRPGRGLNFG